MIPIYTSKLKEEIDKLLKIGFTYLIDQIEWLSLIFIVPKHNRKLWICIDYIKLNKVTKIDLY